MRVLVTGAGGFIGSALVRHLRSRGAEVRRLVRRASDADDSTGSTVVVPDLATADWNALLAGVDRVVHLVARTHSADLGDPAALSIYQAVNVDLTQTLARACAASGVRRLVFLSSIKVNGERTDSHPFRETDAPAPEDLYGATKWQAEQVLRQVAEDSGLEVVIVRPPLVHGPGVKGNFLRMLQAVDRGLPLPLRSICNRRSVIGLDNLCDFLGLVLEHSAAAGETYLVADAEPLSTPDMLRAMGSALGRPARLLPCPPALLGAGLRLLGMGAEAARLTGSLEVDTAKARQQLDWSPRTTFAAQMGSTVEWWRSGGGA